jgi:hypothetical protein
MARGFESKAVTDQQESALLVPSAREDAPAEPTLIARRRRLELSIVDVKRRLAAAHVGAHRQMLERALAALDDEMASLH